MSEGSNSELRHAMDTTNTRPLPNPLKNLLALLAAVTLGSAIISAALTTWGIHLSSERLAVAQQVDQLKQKLAELQQTQATGSNNSTAQLTNANEKLATMQTELDKAHEQLDQLRLTLERAENEKNLFKQQVQQLQNNLDQANTKLARAQEELLLAKNRKDNQSPTNPLEHAAHLTMAEPAKGLELLCDETNFPVAKRDFAWQWLLGRAQERPVEVKSMRLTRIESLCFNRDCKLFVAIDSDKSIRLYHWLDGFTQLHEKILPQMTVAMHPDGLQFYTAGNDRMIHVWDTLTGRRKLASRPLHQSGITSLGSSRDGKWILTGDADGVIRIWDANTCLDKLNFRGPIGRVRVVLMSDDAKLVISSAADKTIRVWDIPGKRLQTTLAGHSSPIQAMALSKDSSYLVSSDAVSSMRVWNLRQQEEDGTLNDVAVTAMVFTPDGKQIIAGTSTGRMLVWDMARRKKVLDWPLVKDQESVIGLATDDFNFRITTLTCVTLKGTIYRFEIPATSQ